MRILARMRAGGTRLRDGRHKPIPHAMHGGNGARLLSVLAQRVAQEAQTGAERPLADHRLGPHRVEQRRFADHLPGLAHQQPQHGQGLGRHRHELGMMP